MSIFRRRHDPFPNTVRRTTLFIHNFLGGAETTYMLVRRPSGRLSSGMAILIVSLYIGIQQITAQLGRVTSAYPGIVEFEVHLGSGRVMPLQVPADWVRLTFWEHLRFGRRIRTPESFETPVDDTRSETDVPAAPVSYENFRLRPSISMFELNVHAPQED
jgi:hypothetical protein